MRSNFLLALIAIGSAAFAAEPIAVFSAHQEDILLLRIFESDGCCFGVGEVDVHGKSKLAEEVARKKAELAAQSDLLANQVLRDVKWPDAWSRQDIADAITFAKKHLNYSAYGTVRGLQTLYSQIKDDKCVSAVGAPVSELNISRNVDFAVIKKAMDDYEEEQRRLATVTNTPPINVDVPVAANTNGCQVCSPSCSTPIDFGEGKKVLMDNSDKDDLLF